MQRGTFTAKSLSREAHAAGYDGYVADPSISSSLSPRELGIVADHNHDPRSFSWTADTQRVLAAARRGNQALESLH